MSEKSQDKRATSSQGTKSDQKSSETVNLTPEELRKISGGPQAHPLPPQK